MARLQLGTAFLRRYVVLGPIGHGGVSVVYKALDVAQGRKVAIKVLDPTLAGGSYASQRVRREALITDRIRHPAVPRIHEYGDAPLPDGTVLPYVVMELVTGTVLSTLLERAPLGWLDAVRVAAHVADVLAVAHRRGVVHRDLSPANIMVGPDGVRIIDFGVAITVPTNQADAGPFVLPPPELPANDFAGAGEPADDVYALGVLLYHMITGRSPYGTAGSAPIASGGDLRWIAPTPVLAVPGLPRQVAEICRRCMAKQPANRPDAATVALDLWALIVNTTQRRRAAIESGPAVRPALPSLPEPTPAPPRMVRPSPPPHTPNRRTTGELRRRRRHAWSGPTTGQHTVV